MNSDVDYSNVIDEVISDPTLRSATNVATPNSTIDAIVGSELAQPTLDLDETHLKYTKWIEGGPSSFCFAFFKKVP